MERFYDTRKTDARFVDDRLIEIVRRLRDLAPSNVLDLACGRGALLTLMARACPAATLVGADISSSSVDACLALGFSAVVADVATELPFETGSFDVVVFGEVIEHIVDPDFALTEIARVLRIGGHVIVTTPNLASWFNRLLLLGGIQPIFTETSLHVNLGRRFRVLGQWNSTQGHLKIFTLAAIREILSANGFSIVSTSGVPFYVPTPLKALDRLISRVPSLASNFVIVAKNLGQRSTSYPQKFEAYV